MRARADRSGRRVQAVFRAAGKVGRLAPALPPEWPRNVTAAVSQVIKDINSETCISTAISERPLMNHPRGRKFT